MKRLLSDVYLHLIAGVIALGILGISAHTLWMDRQNLWQEAEKSSRNVLTTIARDLDGKIELLDTSLKGAMAGLRHPDFQRLPPDLQYRMLFDRAASASFMGKSPISALCISVVQNAKWPALSASRPNN